VKVKVVFVWSAAVLSLAALAGCGCGPERGENLYQSGSATPLSTDEVPATSLVVEVFDDGRCAVRGTEVPSLDDVIRRLESAEFPPVSAIFLKSQSKRAPSDDSLGRLCEYAASVDVDLFASWPRSGGTLVLGTAGASRAARHKDVALLVRSTGRGGSRHVRSDRP
jgi:hypothetical protein